MLQKRIFIFFIFLFRAAFVFAQGSYYYTGNIDYRNAIDLYDHHNYSNANALFKKVFTTELNPENKPMNLETEDLIRVNSRFYSAICELNLNQIGADKAVLEIAKEYPYSPMALSIDFHLGTYYFNNKDFTRAYLSLEKANPNSITDDEFDELNFDLGYCYLSFNRNEDADTRFAKLLSHKGPFYEDALYYSGHLAYLRRDFPTALAKFSALSAKGKYADIYPIYINQIYLSEAKYDQVIKNGQENLAKGKTRHRADWDQILGSAYYLKGDFQNAIHYFEDFKLDSISKMESNQIRSQIGNSYYKLGNYSAAIHELEPLYSQKDSYAQNGLYTLGLSYLKTGKKAEARNAFQLCTTIPGDALITENSLVYYSKLSYDLGLNEEAIHAAKIFTTYYPKSSSIEEIKTLEGEILLNSKNYPDAYKTLKSINNRSPIAELAFQKVCLDYGLEEYTLDHFPESILFFNESTQHPSDKPLLALAHYWQGESFYELKDYDQSLIHYGKYFNLTDPKTSTVYRDALYGNAYANFKKGNYSKALELFQKINQGSNQDPNQVNDAKARMADCYFMMKQYGLAKNLYSQDAGAGASGSDYSLFQSANIMGLQNNWNGKIKTLQTLLSNYPKSTFADQAQYGIGTSYLSMGNSEKSIEEFKKLKSQYSSSSLVPKAQLNIGLIYFNNNQDDEALNQYKQVVSLYPGSPESKTALASIKNIYQQKNDAQGFIAYASSLGNNTVSQNAQDSVTYQSANQQFLQGNFQASIQSLGYYCSQFPNGNFIQEAHYNRSRALEKLGRTEEAQIDYSYLASLNPKGKYSEEAELKLGGLYLKIKNYSSAIPIFQNLASTANQAQDYGLGIEGLMNSYSALGNADSTLFYAQKLKSFTKNTPIQLEEINLQGGKAFLLKGDTSSATSYLDPLTHGTRSIMAAEARYTMADIQFHKGNYKGSQKILFDLIKQLPTYNYWIGKSFVLLADNYLKMGDLFQAKSTLQSVLDHYDKEDDVKSSAREKLAKLPQGQ